MHQNHVLVAGTELFRVNRTPENDRLALFGSAYLSLYVFACVVYVCSLCCGRAMPR